MVAERPKNLRVFPLRSRRFGFGWHLRQGDSIPRSLQIFLTSRSFTS